MEADHCGNCFYHRDVGNPDAIACHRYPATITEAKEQTVTAYFPLLTRNNWCGEHKRMKLHMARTGTVSTISRRR